ncbi:MAG: recombinase family protein, partial [Chloroflexi bacterium]|nr:recombinase family protein [Chloroflexota bacterium]
MTRPLRALLYAAVSTPGQYRDEVSVPDQLAQGRALCAARNWPVVGEIVIPGFSRNYDFLDELRADCPEYDAFVRKIDAAAMDVVVARDYDRLWRTAALQSQVSARCRRSGVQIYSLNQPVEPSDPEGLGRDTNDARLVMEAMGGVFAEIDNRTRVRRMHAGKVARVRNEGLPITGWAPYGYRLENHKSIWIVDEAEAHWVRYIFRRRLEGAGAPTIARELMARGVRSPGGARAPQGAEFWHTRTLLNILANPAYYGGVRWGSAFNPQGAHEPIIDRADWERVQELGRTRFPRYTKMPDPAREELVGIVRCGHCGYAMKVRRDYPTRGPHGKTRRDLSRPFHVVSCARAIEYPADCAATHTHRLADVLGWLIPQVQE